MTEIGVDEVTAAVVAIDCHRGHLDPEVATMPAAPDVAQRLIEANRRFLGRCRERGVPIVHLVTSYRDVAEIRANPFWRTRADDAEATRKNVERHNIEGSAGCEIIPSLFDVANDWVVDTKKRYDCFLGTDLDFLLKSHGVNTLLITGINTNSCVLATVAAAKRARLCPRRRRGLCRYHGRARAACRGALVHQDSARLGDEQRARRPEPGGRHP